MELSVKDDVVSGELNNDESTYTASVKDNGLVSFLVSIMQYLDDRYGGEMIPQIIDELQDNEGNINDDLVRADIENTEIITDGDGSSYTHTIIEKGSIKTYYLDEDLWGQSESKSLWEALEESDDNDDLAQTYGSLTIGEYYTKQARKTGNAAYPPIAKKIIAFANGLNEGQLDYLIEELKWFDSSVKISKKGNVGEEVYNACKKIDRREQWLKHDDGEACLYYLENTVYRYDVLVRLKAVLDNRRPTIRNKTFVLQYSTDELRDKTETEAAGGFIRQAVSGKTDYFVIEDNFEEDRWFLSEKILKILEMIEAGGHIRMVLYSDFREALKQEDIDRNAVEKSIGEAIESQKDAYRKYHSMINTVKEIHCDGICYVISDLHNSPEEENEYWEKRTADPSTYYERPDKEKEVHNMLFFLGAIEKSSMSKKVGLLIINDENTDTKKVSRAVELIAEGHNPIIVTFAYFKRLYDEGKIIK